MSSFFLRKARRLASRVLGLSFTASVLAFLVFSNLLNTSPARPSLLFGRCYAGRLWQRLLFGEGGRQR